MVIRFDGVVDLNLDVDEAVLVEHDPDLSRTAVLHIKIQKIQHRLCNSCSRVLLLLADSTAIRAPTVPDLLKPCLIRRHGPQPLENVGITPQRSRGELCDGHSQSESGALDGREGLVQVD